MVTSFDKDSKHIENSGIKIASNLRAEGMRRLWRQGAVVVATSPLRVDLCGMTDFIPAEGWCINSTVAGLTARMRMQARKDEQIRIDAGSYGESVFTLDQIGRSSHMFMRALALHNYDARFDFGMNVKVNCEFGAIGLSTSSSVASLYNIALNLVCFEPYEPLETARQTQAIEPHWYGRQDQLAVAYGGFNLWHMLPGIVRNGRVEYFGEVERYPINMPVGARDKLSEDCFLIYDSGIEEGASGVLNSVSENYLTDPTLQSAFECLNALAREIYLILNQPNGSQKWLFELGHAFDCIREEHEKLHPSVTNQRMQALFRQAKKAGALGGRYSGAGGRGALTFICKPGETAKITAALDLVDTPHVGPDGRKFTHGRQIHFGGFGNTSAVAWFDAG